MSTVGLVIRILIIGSGCTAILLVRTLVGKYLPHLFPELAHFEDTDLREEALSQAKSNTGMLLVWRVLSSVCVILLIGTSYALPGSLSSNVLLDWVALWSIVILLAVVFFGGPTWLTRNRIRRNLRMQLIKHGIPVCCSCGYDVRGQIQLRCPECGQPFDARLSEMVEKHNNPKSQREET